MARVHQYRSVARDVNSLTVDFPGNIERVIGEVEARAEIRLV
jgi:hypothetical protein